MKCLADVSSSGWKGENYDGNMGGADLAKIFREFLKATFPDCKFSVTRRQGGYTTALDIRLIEAPFEVFISGDSNGICNMQFKGSSRCTEQANKMFGLIKDFVNSYRRDDSDSMRDYFDTNFYCFYEIGCWNRPFKVVQRPLLRRTQDVDTK
jgi:hypothetical protein